jgi:hypothetical protein
MEDARSYVISATIPRLPNADRDGDHHPLLMFAITQSSSLLVAEGDDEGSSARLTPNPARTRAVRHLVHYLAGKLATHVAFSNPVTHISRTHQRWPLAIQSLCANDALGPGSSTSVRSTAVPISLVAKRRCSWAIMTTQIPRYYERPCAHVRHQRLYWWLASQCFPHGTTRAPRYPPSRAGNRRAV